MDKLIKIVLPFVIISSLTACVTRNYSDNDKPVVERDFSANEKAMTRITLGLGYLNVGNTSQAKFNLERAKNYAPKLVDVYTAFAHYYEVVGEPEQAESAYKEALSIESDNADALNNFGVFLCRQNREKEAETQWLKAIAVPSYIKVAESYQNIALCLLTSGDFTKAEHYLNKALDHSPNNASSLYRKAQLYYAQQNYQRSEDMIRRYERATRKFQLEVIALAYKVYNRQGKTVTAKNYASMLMKMFPNSPEAKAYLDNELAQIPADELAQRYQASLAPSDSETPPKKVIKFSPNKPLKTLVSTPSTPVAAAPEEKATKQAEPVTLPEEPPLTVTAKDQPQSTEIATSESATVSEISAAANSDEPKPRPLSSYNQSGVSNPGSQTSEVSTAPEQTMMTIPIHVMSKGESLFTVSKKYNITMRALERWNNLRRSQKIQIGQVLYLSDPKKAAKAQ